MLLKKIVVFLILLTFFVPIQNKLSAKRVRKNIILPSSYVISYYKTKKNLNRWVKQIVYYSPPYNYKEAGIEKLIETLSNQSLEKKVEAISHHFLGRRYIRWPLGEGFIGKYDHAPLYRFDRFDCTTYIETVIALAQSNSLKEFIITLNKIRYKNGKISFLNRNHFPIIDWIPNNINQNVITDITSKVADQFPVEKASTLIDKREWFLSLPYSRFRVSYWVNKYQLISRLYKELEKSNPVEGKIKYIGLNTIFDSYKNLNHFLDNIPSGTIINVVGSHYSLSSATGSDYNITHQGFCIRKNGIPYFRHASSTRWRGVVEVPLKLYLRILLYKQVVGINILQVNPA